MRVWLQSIWRVIKGRVIRPSAEEPPAPFVPAEIHPDAAGMAAAQRHWQIGDPPTLVYPCPRCESPVILYQLWCRRCGERQPQRPEPRTRAERLDEWQ